MKKRSRTRLSSSFPSSLLLKKEGKKVIYLELLADKCHFPRVSKLLQPDLPSTDFKVTKANCSVPGPKEKLVLCSRWGQSGWSLLEGSRGPGADRELLTDQMATRTADKAKDTRGSSLLGERQDGLQWGWGGAGIFRKF